MPDVNPLPFDDELLSAYLDDELAPEERARVEEQLAADPAARQLLDELRTVSRAMKDLPAATLGADLRESVMRRAERAMLVSREQSASEQLPTNSQRERFAAFPIGRSRRAWFWAGAALAAGLMLMIFDRDPAHHGDLPRQVAQSELDAKLVRNEPLPALELRAVEPLADGQVAATSEADGKRSIEPLDNLAKETSSVMLGREMERPMQPTAVPTGGFGGRSGGVAFSPRDDVARSKEVDAGKDLLVVHVNMKPEALHGRAFDDLLVKCEIDVEEPAGEPSLPSEPQDIDVVMVEAVPLQVYKCLDEIKKDESNYLGVAVDDRLANSQRELAESRPAADMKQYNRGVVPNQQQVELAPDNNFYFKADRSQRESEQLVRDGTGFGQLQVAKQPQMQTRGRFFAQDAATPAPAASSTSSSGTSDVLSSEISGQAAGSDAQSDLYLGAKVNVARRAVQQLKTKADTLQVLFVLTCPAEHATPAATPVSGAEPREGLKNSD